MENIDLFDFGDEEVSVLKREIESISKNFHKKKEDIKLHLIFLELMNNINFKKNLKKILMNINLRNVNNYLKDVEDEVDVLFK